MVDDLKKNNNGNEFIKRFCFQKVDEKLSIIA